MPMPGKKKGESKQEWISKCIATETKNGHPTNQSAAICYSKYKEFEKEQRIETASLKLKK
jgi:hypothetical protein